jgi:hypothetical protein
MFRNTIFVLLVLSSAMMVFAAPAPVPEAAPAPGPEADDGYYVSLMTKTFTSLGFF